MSPETEVDVNSQTNATNESKRCKRKENISKLSSRKQRVRNLQLELCTLEEPSSINSRCSDTVFEPTIEMMVNDFDDEQTLNEEEALAALESDYQDEVATLKEESEMPIEQLLAKYKLLSQPTLPKKRNDDLKISVGSTKVNIIPNTEDNGNICNENINEAYDIENPSDSSSNSRKSKRENISNRNENVPSTESVPKRSYLLELYPDEMFNSDRMANTIENTCDSDVSEENEIENDFIKKTIMVGPAYQAVIPDGLSKYGDVLPYENEDKLIWEPSQVSEREVECYLDYYLKAKEGKDCQQNSEEEKNSEQDFHDIERLNASNCNEIAGVIKDNEQALHLLVQCGYDFKEALRRKRLNAVPQTGSMSLWSDNECQKFEEGIQKYGKDFLKIRQNEIRTRSMREIVQFYYLWKKSERRDHDFANSDTVDHMDIYLNEGHEYSHNISPAGLSSAVQLSTANNSSDNLQKRVSILSNSNSDKRRNPTKSITTIVPDESYSK